MKRTYREFRQGTYKPLNREKCLNKGDIIYRSNLELRLFKVLDSNTNVLHWSSEQTIIPYIHPIKSQKAGTKITARYFVDIFAEMNIRGETRKFLFEIKPKSQTQIPKISKRKKPSTVLYENMMYSINQAKWAAASEYAKKKGMQFVIITEDSITNYENK